MKYKSNFMSFLAVTAICFTLFSFKNSDETEKKIGISKEIAILDITSEESLDQQNVVAVGRVVVQGATALTRSRAIQTISQALLAIEVADIVTSSIDAVTSFFGGEMLEGTPEFEELTLLKDNELGKL